PTLIPRATGSSPLLIATRSPRSPAFSAPSEPRPSAMATAATISATPLAPLPSSRHAFMAIASPPGGGAFEFLVKAVPGATAEKLCGLRDGDVVELGAVMGKGFPIERVTPADAAETLLLFATGTGISPIRSLIEFGFAAKQRADVRLYYGARNLETMAYQERFAEWESSGLKIVPVLSRPDDGWKGERGYVQRAFLEAKNIANPTSTGAVLCGQSQMIEEVTSALTADGVSQDKILKNF
uniref:Oxidoreductase FAD/NAD(P)-binding domain-containing protein n=1 Tax=Aegilops tauschii subsp. strangulata TaxID=200361 RepID=A0A453ANG9_AEGTS